MQRVKGRIIKILSQQPECRNDDVLLAFSVWESEGLVLTGQQKCLLGKLTKPGSIVRIRAYIQNAEQRFKSTCRRRQ